MSQLATMWSAALGLGIGLLYTVGAVAAARVAMRRDPGRFVAIVLIGTLLRMMVALGILAALAVWVPLDVVALVGAFLATFLVGLAFEILHMLHLKTRT